MKEQIERNSAGIPVREFWRSGVMVSILGFGGRHISPLHRGWPGVDFASPRSARDEATKT